MLKKFLVILIGAVVLPIGLYAQGITTASLNGTVATQGGEPLIGANVVAIHEPSGSTFGAATRSDGRYNITGIRVGGPYTVTVSYIGYKTAEQKEVYVALGQDLRINFSLSEEAVELAEIVTVAERDAILTASNTGTATNVTTEQIERLPTITRSIKDFTRLTPQVADAAGGTTIAGKNNRYNNFQVDGAILTDAFGLDDDGYPTGQVSAQPISLDAIQEFQVQVTPYDVRSGSFAGGLINAITRSGTNQFSGSGYFFGRNESFVGELNEQEFSEFEDFQTGFRVGGPIMRNKVFFFVNGEIRRRNQPTTAGLLDSNAPTQFPLTSAEMQEIVDITQQQYDYNPGGFDPFTNETNNDKIFARLDINLSQKHRLTLRHNYVNGDRDDGIDRGDDIFTLESNQFKRDNETNSTVLQLNSLLGNNLANEARVAYTTVRDKRTPLAGIFPEVQLNLEDEEGREIGEIRLGVERFSQQNALDQDILEITDNLHYFVGDHTITVGTHNEFISFTNLFIQDFYGAYEFDSIEEYRNGTPTRYLLSTSQVPGNDRPIAEWDYMQLGFYAQDEWKVNPKFNLTFGLRADVPIMPEDPLRNMRFEQQFSGLRTDEVPSGNILWSPRAGFNYDLSEDRTTQLRGGLGMFAGLPPAVWLSNQYSNTGVDFARIDVATFRGQEVPMFEPDPFNQPLPPGVDPNEPQTTEVDVTASDFKMPQVLRANLGIDRQLPQGLVGTMEFVYSKNINEVRFKNLNIGDNGDPVGTTPDGRPDYGGEVTSDDFTNVILLDNTSKGYSWNITGRVQKQLGRGPFAGLFGSLAYTLSEAKDINSGRSSRAISNWQFNETDDPNGTTLARSDFLVRHRILGDLSYEFKYGNGFATILSLFYEGRSGAPFSYMYNDDVNGDGVRGNDLAYIPATEDEVIVTQGTWQEIDTFIRSDDALQDNRGQIFERNSANAPWQNRLDLRIAQRIPSLRTQNFEITLDVLNFLNLLNNDWGQVEFVPFDAFSIFNFEGYDPATGKPMISLRASDRNDDGQVTRDDIFSVSDLASRWQVQLGVRYSF